MIEIQPDKISNFNLTNDELEYNLLFWVAAAGKNGVTAAKTLGKFFELLRQDYPLVKTNSPFVLLLAVHSPFIAPTMKKAGIGCSTAKSDTFLSLACAGLDLRTCSVDDLIKIKGIGLKTAKGFLAHTRPGQRFAVIDTHVLKFLRHRGINNVPKTTPGKKSKRYGELEKEFLKICDEWGIEPYDLDLQVWNHYRVTPDVPFTKGHIN